MSSAAECFCELSGHAQHNLLLPVGSGASMGRCDVLLCAQVCDDAAAAAAPPAEAPAAAALPPHRRHHRPLLPVQPLRGAYS
jgi:hypothetical protein